jgi:hypothetical protein
VSRSGDQRSIRVPAPLGRRRLQGHVPRRGLPLRLVGASSADATMCSRRSVYGLDFTHPLVISRHVYSFESYVKQRRTYVVAALVMKQNDMMAPAVRYPPPHARPCSVTGMSVRNL